MRILSHRGYWKVREEQNCLVAFTRSLKLGFGIETDIRDFERRLVISHDMATGDCIGLDEFLALYQIEGEGLPLALNVKADGLQSPLQEVLAAHGVDNYFVFDMSVPDAVQYIEQGFRVFLRQSEFELPNALCDRATGIWLDSFGGDWFDQQVIKMHLTQGKQVCVVSPELHKREKAPLWTWLKETRLSHSSDVLLCTDFPENAREFFNA